MGLQWWGIGEWSAAPLDNASLCLKSTDVPNAHHGCTKWVPRVYQMGTTGVPNEYHGCTKWVPRVYQMSTTGVPNGYHGCTKCAQRVPRVYQSVARPLRELLRSTCGRVAWSRDLEFLHFSMQPFGALPPHSSFSVLYGSFQDSIASWWFPSLIPGSYNSFLCFVLLCVALRCFASFCVALL